MRTYLNKTAEFLQLRVFGERDTEGCYTISKEFRLLPDFQISETFNEGDAGYWQIHIAWLWFSIFQPLWMSGATGNWSANTRRWGWYFYGNASELVVDWGAAFHFRWGIPFREMQWKLTQILTLDLKRVVYDEFEHGLRDWERRREVGAQNSVQLPYRYKLKSGEVQERIATVFVERMTWRRKWSRRDIVRDCLEISFDGEVGERTGEWKGGVTGCGFEMLPGESVETCLRRMERQRIFD